MRERCRQTELSKASAIQELNDQITGMQPGLRELKRDNAVVLAANAQLKEALHISEQRVGELLEGRRLAESTGLELQQKLQACATELHNIHFEDGMSDVKGSLAESLQALEARLQVRCTG